MNKIYKVVWSKVKNCYVVVSEVAKNVITGGVKSAKVGSSVASGLVMGALLAVPFVFGCGVVPVEAATYQQAQGMNIIIAGNAQNPVADYVTGSGERVVGGWNSLSGVTNTTLNSNISVAGGEFNMIVGGNYTSTATDMTVASTNVVIDGATVKQVIGGTGFNGVNDSDVAADRTANMTIKSGTFGSAIDNTNCPEMHVVGGDLVKTGSGSQNATAKLAETNLNVSGGEFDAAVYGGSAAIRYYGGYTSGDVSVTVDEANVEITGGTFNDAIVAGGLAWGHETDSVVKEATLNISGESGKLDINCDIYAGGLDGALGAGHGSAVSKVEKATINIDNATVNNVYGSGGNIENVKNTTSVKYANDYDWKYKQNTDDDAVVDTALTLENVTANTVDIQKGSINLNGENTVELMKAGADVKITMNGTAGTLNAEINGGVVDLGNGNTWNVKDDSNVNSITGNVYNVAGDGESTLTVVNNKNTGDVDSNGVYSTGSATISNLKNLDVTSANRHAIEVATGMEIDVEGVKLTSNNGNGILAYGDLTVKANDMGILAQNGHGIRAAEDDGHAAKVDIDVERLTIVVQNPAETAIKVSDGAFVDVNASETANINGQVLAEVDSTVKLSGGTVNVTSVEDALDTFGGTIEVDATNINIKSTEKDGIQADDANVTLKGENVTVEGKTWGVKNIAENDSSVVINATNVTIKGAEGNAIWAVDAGGKGVVNVNATETADIQGQVYVEIDSAVKLSGGTVNVTSVEDALDTFGGTIEVDATNINIKSTEKDGIQADDANVTLKGENVTVEGKTWGIKNIDETNSNVVVDGTNVTITGTEGNAIWAMGSGEGKVTVNATDTANINGQVYVEIDSEVALSGGTVNVTSAEDALDTFGGTIEVDATNINIKSTKKDGIQADDATVTLKGEKVNIEAGAWGIKNIDETNSNVEINATDVNIKGVEGAIWAYAGGNGKVTVNGEGTTTVIGDIKAEGNSEVDLLLNDANSYLKGAVTTVDDAFTKITMNDGAAWNVTGQSKVSELAGNIGIISVETAKAGLVTIDNNKNDNLMLNITDGGDVGVDVKEGIKQLKETVKINEGNGIDLSVDEIALKAEVKEVDGKVTTTIKPGDEFVVESDVISTGDVVAGGVSLKETAQGLVDEAQARQEADQKLQANIDAEAQARQEADNRLQANIDANAANIANNASNIEANKQAIDAEKAAREEADAVLSDAIDNVAGDIAETKAQVEDNKAAIEQNAQDIANETADRVAADNKLQANIDKESVDRQIADAKEAVARAEADQELQNAIDAEEQARKDADAAEAKARQDADAKLEEALKSEVGNLNNRIDKVDAKIDKVGAMAAAMASLKTMGYDPEAPTEIAVGIGQYRNETGIAIGAFHYPNKNFMLNFSLSTAGDEVMGGIGATWKIGRKR